MTASTLPFLQAASSSAAPRQAPRGDSRGVLDERTAHGKRIAKQVAPAFAAEDGDPLAGNGGKILHRQECFAVSPPAWRNHPAMPCASSSSRLPLPTVATCNCAGQRLLPISANVCEPRSG